MDSLPIIDLAGRDEVAPKIARACREEGFFYVVGHGVDLDLAERLEALAREFFAWPEARKREIDMRSGGRAWRGYFGVGDELTSGLPDRKEGLYFGAESGPDHPKVQIQAPFFGANLFPRVAGFADCVHEYMRQVTGLGHRLASELSVGLGLSPEAIHQRLTNDPLTLFRIFHYPPFKPKKGAQERDPSWSVGEHTDYGLLTILAQDDVGGLEVKTPNGWIEAPTVPGALVCNIGDMLDRLTGGEYRSTPHRVLNRSDRGRISLAFFFDPNVDARIEPLSARSAPDDASERWDGASVHHFEGTYGEYLLGKVARVFPQLEREVL